MFTKQQIEEIATKLRYLSKKDTDLPLANTVNYNDCILTIVTTGANYKINVSDFFKIIKSTSIELTDTEDNTTLIDGNSITTLLLNAKELQLINPANETDVVIIKNTNTGLYIGKHITVNGNIVANNASLEQIDVETLNADNINVSENVSIEGTLHADDEIDSSEDISSSKNINADENVTAGNKVLADNDVEAGTGANKVALKETNRIAKGWYIDKINPEETESTIRDKFVLKDANGTVHGDPIKIYKDSAIRDSKLGYANATVNSTTGAINIGTPGTGEIADHPQYLIVSVYTQDGTYTKISINFSQFIIENEFDGNRGLGVSNNVVYIKLASDKTTTKYIHFVNGVLTMTSELDEQVTNCEYQAGRAEDAADDYNDVIKPAAQTATDNANTATTNANNATTAANNAASSANSAATNANNAAATIGDEDDEPDPDGTIWARYKEAEGTPEDEPNEDGSRWARYNNAEESRSSTITELQEKVEELDENKANIDGYYSQMSVGAAENLVGGNETSREFTEDTAGGTTDITDGIVQIDRIKGNTIVWNQLCQYPLMTSKIDISSESDTSVVTDKGLECTKINNNSTLYYGKKIPKLKLGNKLYIHATIVADNFPEIYYLSVKVRKNSDTTADLTPSIIKATEIKSIYINVTNEANIIYLWAKCQSNIPIGSKITITKMECFDLTLMFGAGNEPATVEEFEKMFPLDYYDYNAGQLLSLNPTGIKTVGFNAYNPSTGKAYVIGGKQYQITGSYTSITENGVTITPDSNGKFTPTKNGELTIAGGNSTTTCVHLVWSGVRNGEYEEHWEETRNIPIAKINTDGTITESAIGKTRLFPDGLCSAGDVYDEITPTKAIKRIGKVDLGSFEFTKVHTSRFYVQMPLDCKAESNVKSVCSLYERNYDAYSETVDKSHIITNYLLHIYDTDYTDAAVFKAAMSGVYLYYELATPIEVTFAEPLNLTYRVSDFGIETLLPINTATPVTTPIRLDVVYGLNVVDFARNADKNYLTIEDSTGDNGSSFTNLRSALSTAFGINIVPTYDSTNKRYTFTITDNRRIEIPPTSSVSTGIKGTWAIDENYFYFCVHTNYWIKIAKTNW